MINHSFFIFIIGWTLWFLLDKHPASLGLMLPVAADELTLNFQIAFDLLRAGYLRASFTFIWKAHYIVISLAFGMMTSIIFQAAANFLRRRRLHQLMWPDKQNTDKTHEQDIDRPS
jgi:hypothetical protein